MVSLSPPTQNLLIQLRDTLQAFYRERLHRVMLFGSYARGEARPDSDMDILVVLKGVVSPGREVAKVSGYLADLSLEYDKVIRAAYLWMKPASRPGRGHCYGISGGKASLYDA